jgi:tripartite-type tricarboxylate transporter receptor subunit TctC
VAYAHSGLAAAPNLAMALLAEATGITPLGVGFRGEPEIINALLTGAVQAGFGFLAAAPAQIAAGRLLGLAVTAAERVSQLPEVPSFAELDLPSVRIGAWWAVAVPRATPPATQARLIEAVQAVRALPEVASRLLGAGVLPLPIDGPDLLAFNARERLRHLELFRRLGVEPE